MRLTTPLEDGSLRVTRLRGTEKISQIYSFELAVQSPIHKQIDIYSLLGKDIRVDIEIPDSNWLNSGIDGELAKLETRRFCGFVSKVTDLRQDDNFRYFDLQVNPRLWLWQKKADCRIFQEHTVPQIVKSITDGLIVKLDLHDQYHPRPYCVQYNETSYDFIKRLFSEEGIFYYFEHQYEGQDDEQRHRGERLVITDSVRSLPNIVINDSQAEEPGKILFDDVQGGNRDSLRISKWQKSQEIVTTRTTLRDNSFQLPEQSLEANEEVPETVKIADTEHKLAPLDHDLESYLYPGNYAKRFDGIAAGGGERPDSMKKVFTHNGYAAQRDVERHASSSIKIHAESDCPQLIPGHKFVLQKDRVISGPYFVVGITHDARLNADFRSGESKSDHSYSNQFDCQAEVQPFQPPQPDRKPKILGFQTATVVGPSDKEVFSDKFGRIKVQFHWDREGKKDADSSCWIRVAQVWAGNRWGAFFWPRVGHEVVVTFENGDPDLPLIIGSVYNAKNMPPMKLPDRLMSSGIKSCSIGGNPIENFSCVIFHDGAGEEYLQMHSETHECLTSETSKLNYSSGQHVSFKGGGSAMAHIFGSGSGGGPSANHAGPTGGVRTDSMLDDLNELLDPKVMNVLESLGVTGSGSGGFISGILEGSGVVPRTGSQGKNAAEIAGVKNEVGSVEMITGNTIETRLGQFVEHSLGRNVEMTADLEGLLYSLLISIASALKNRTMTDMWKWDKGGYLNQVYGNRQEVTYGHSIEVRRGKEISVTQDHFFGTPSPADVEITYGMSIAATSATAIRIIAILILLLDVAMAIAIKCVMESPPKENEN